MAGAGDSSQSLPEMSAIRRCRPFGHPRSRPWLGAAKTFSDLLFPPSTAFQIDIGEVAALAEIAGLSDTWRFTPGHAGPPNG